MQIKAREIQIAGILVPRGGIGAHGCPELGRARPRIGGDLLVRRAYRAMVKEPETGRRASTALRRQVSGALLLGSCPVPEELLDQPVLQRMEGDDHKAATRSEQALRRRQAACQLA